MTQTRFLFVYGTLRPAAQIHFGRAMRRRLASESRLIGSATLVGQLVDLGRYPGLVAADDSRVHGDLVELDKPQDTWPWLDAYEGIDPDRPEESDYIRVIREANRANGEICAASVYVLRHQPAQIVPVPSGDWLAK